VCHPKEERKKERKIVEDLSFVEVENPRGSRCLGVASKSIDDLV